MKTYIEMNNDEIKKHYPIGQQCMYYNKLAVVHDYVVGDNGRIRSLECWYEGPRGRMLRFFTPNLRVLRPF